MRYTFFSSIPTSRILAGRVEEVLRIFKIWAVSVGVAVPAVSARRALVEGLADGGHLSAFVHEHSRVVEVQAATWAIFQ